MKRPGTIAGRRGAARRTVWSLALALATAACGAGQQAGPTDGHGPADAEEAARGPHGGRWLEDGSFALELALSEAEVPAELRAWVFAGGEPRDPGDVALEVVLRRLGGRVERIAFAPRGDYLAGVRGVAEPHSFDVEVVAREAGGEHRFAYASYEDRVVLGAEQRASAGIEIAEAGPAEIREHIALNGRIAPNEDVLAHVAARFPGVVRSVHKRLGDPVAPGDLLAVIESNASLHPYELRAQLAGTVIAKEITPGELVASDRAAFVIADLSTVWVDLDVYRPDFGRLRVGQPVRVAAGDGTEPAETVLAYLSPIGAPSTQTLLARAVLPNPDRSWRPGLFVTADVETSLGRAEVTVAAAALQRLREREVVFVAEGDVLEAQPVRLGRRDGGRVEVLEGLAPGQRYVAQGSFIVKAEAGKSGASHDH